MTVADLPVPPLPMRELVGRPETDAFENPTGAPIFDGLAPAQWRSYLDFGSGCGRSARRLALQRPRPERYVGVDLHAGMVAWCSEHLAPLVPGFTFVHHDVYSPGLNPDRTRPWVLPLPVEDQSASLVEASSVFTHLIQPQAEHYLNELARVLTDDGLVQATFFLFDKTEHPYMQDEQNALYINPFDATNAVAFDRRWLLEALDARALVLTEAIPPTIRGFHWQLRFGRAAAGWTAVDLPEDTAPPGRYPPPRMRSGTARFGMDGRENDAVALRVPEVTVPGPDPLAVELAAAKEYIASLEEHLRIARAEVELRADGSSGSPDVPG